MYSLNIGIFAEGNTDYRFWIPMIEKLFIKVGFEANRDIDIYVDEIKINKTGKSFNDQVSSASIEALKCGMQILVIHRDADSVSNRNTYSNLINPSFLQHDQYKGDKVDKLIALVPIQETESWLLADKVLFKEQLGTNKSNLELGINKNPESISQPKELIEQAIRTVNKDKPSKRRNINISELYQPIGSELELEKLKDFKSFIDFKENVTNAFKYLNLIH